MPGTMLDLPGALRAAGLRVWLAPDWLTNGHTYRLIRPRGGVLHHTAGHGLRAVYGLPDARPDVPQPRCNVWTPRPGTQPYDVAVITAGRAWQAGTGRAQAYDDLFAGRFNANVADAADRFGFNSDDVDAGWTSTHTLGNEVEWNTGDPWTERQLDVVAVTMRVSVDVFGWPGVGCWAHHRQLTYRKPDMQYRGDIWTRAASTHSQEAGMAGVTPDDLDKIRGVVRDEVAKAYSLLAYGDQRVDTLPDTHPENLQRIRDDYEAGLKTVSDRLDALQLPAPVPTTKPTPAG